MVTLLGGETLFREQEMGEALYIVLSGRLHLVTLASELYDEVVSEVGHGELVGETTVVNTRPYGVTATAVRDTNLARLSRTGFHRFLTKHPVAATKVLTSRLLSGLESSRSSRPKRSVTSITVVPTSRDVPLETICARLTAALSRFDFALHLNRRKVDRETGVPGIASATDADVNVTKLIEWLGEQELEHDT